LALDTPHHKPLLWPHYFDDTFVVWPHGPEQLQNLEYFKAILPVHYGNRVGQCDSFLGCSGHQSVQTNKKKTPTLANISTSAAWEEMFNSEASQ
jgi:hypothetical protein